MAEKKETISDMIGSIKENINSSLFDRKIPDIITFVNDPEWLGLPFRSSNPVWLYPVQELMLKCFYRGSVGNENLNLTEHELQLIKDLGLITDDKGNVFDKYYSSTIFSELVLVWGRRSGKDFISSIIALYEAMKLLECHGGDPYALYELSSANTINVLTIANSRSQARIAFEEIKSKLLYSKYFQDKFSPDAFTSESIYLLTPKDKEDNIQLKEKGLPLRKGSVGIIVGHSNSDTLLGMGCIVLILDEVASYKMTGSSSSGDRIYTAMMPTISTYCKKTYKKDENGNFILNEFGQKIILERRYDGKVVSISSPRAREGKFFELYQTAGQAPERLCLRLATWEVNPSHSRESLREVNKTMSEAEFNMEFGAEFSGIGAENFFTEEQINSCFLGHRFQLRDYGEPGKTYFIHIDPASTSHNYALIVCHKEFFLNQVTKRADFIVVVDHIKFWHPTEGKPVDVREVNDYVIKLKRKFHIVLLTYDQWNSQESIRSLKQNSIPNKLTRFNRPYKTSIYRELEDLINGSRLKIPYHYLLRQEMIELRRRFDGRGFKVLPKTDGDGVKSDDIIDCVAGACFMAVQKYVNHLPSGKVVNMDVVPSGSSRLWRNMQGGGMYGTGEQVTRTMERLNSWPWYKRR